MGGIRQYLRGLGSALVGKSGGHWFNMLTSGAERGADGVTSAYTQSLYANAGINMIGRNIASGRLEAHADEKSGKAPVEDERITRWKANPARGYKWSQFVEFTNIYLKSEGEFFWLMGDEWLVPHPDVAKAFPPLILAAPSRMAEIVESGEVVGWRYTDDGGARHTMLPENVVHVKRPNPANPRRGLSDLQVAKYEMDTARFASRFFRNLMKGNGEKGAIIVAKGGVVDEAQERQIVARLRRHARMRAKGDIAPMFFSGDVDVKDPQVAPLDASFFDGCRMTGEQIFLALGIPASMSTTTVSNSIGSASDFYRMFHDAVIPTGDYICDGIDEVLRRLTGQTVFSSFNFDSHPTMVAARAELTDTAVKLWGIGVPVKDASEHLNLGLPRFPGDDVSYLPFSVAPAGEDDLGGLGETDTGAEDEPMEDDEMPAVAELMRALKAPAASKAESPEDSGEEFQDKRPKKEIELWKSHQRDRASTRKAFKSKFKKRLLAARAQVLKNLESIGGAQDKSIPSEKSQDKSPSIYKRGIAEFLFNLADFKAALLLDFRGVTADALQRAGRQVADELNLDDAFEQPAPFVAEYLRSRENLIESISNQTFAKLKAELEAGVNAGETMAQLSGRVKRAFNGISNSKANTVARTETATVYSQGRHKAMSIARVPYKKWLTSGNANVRPAHASANGQVVRVDEPFTVGGEHLMHPNDPNGSAENVINCECIEIAVESKEE